MQNYISSEKDLDNTISKIANILCEVFKLPSEGIPPFIALINPNTRCFHYYGKKYYNTLLFNSNEKKQRINKAITEVYEKIKIDEIRDFYDEDGLILKVENYLNEVCHSDANAIEIFINLLLKTPISCNYGVIGQCYNTNISRVFHNEDQNKYSGAKEYTEDDPILGREKNQNIFKEIIESLEKVFWEERIVRSAIMVPLILNGKIIGATFIGDEKENSFTYYDYIRFVKFAGEMSVTLLRDAKEYEFLSTVLKDLPNNSFNVAISIFKNLPHIFNITGACLKEKKIYKYLSFNKDDNKAFPEWRENPCTSCDKFENEFKSKKTISFDDICNIHKNNDYLKPRSCLYVNKENIEFILYFDIDENLLKVYEDSLRLAIDDALQLIEINDRNVVVHRAYGHDTTRLFDKIRKNDKWGKKDICKVIEQRNYLMINLFGEDIHVNSEKSIYEEKDILKLWELCKPNINFLSTAVPALCSETIKLFSVGKPLINIKPETIVYKPAFNTIILNLIRNTFQHGDKFCVSGVQIKINDIFTYTQVYKTGSSTEGESLSVLPSYLSSYLIGNNVDYEKSNKGFGHYIIQWICNRFKCNLTIELQNGFDYWIITSDKLPLKGNHGESSYRLSYRITLPEKWE